MCRYLLALHDNGRLLYIDKIDRIDSLRLVRYIAFNVSWRDNCHCLNNSKAWWLYIRVDVWYSCCSLRSMCFIFSACRKCSRRLLNGALSAWLGCWITTSLGSCPWTLLSVLLRWLSHLSGSWRLTFGRLLATRIISYGGRRGRWSLLTSPQ